MTTIHADGLDIEIDPNHWRLFSEFEEGKLLTPLFQVSKGDNVMYYSAQFGTRVGLPGDRLSAEFVRAVLVGYHEESRRWVLGLHLAKTADAKPIFKKLVQWREGDSNEHIQEVRIAARTLSLVLTTPLKVFGEKKLPSRTEDPERSGVTGPLEPHHRERIDRFDVKTRAAEITLPIKAGGFTLEDGRSGLVLRLTRQVKGGVESPLFNLVEFSSKSQTIKLIPPTGLLGSFLGTKAQEIAYRRVKNVEVRYVKEEISHTIPSKDKTFMVEQLTVRHIWSIYLTLPDSSLMLAQSVFTQDPELMQSHVSMRGGDKFQTNSAEGVKYFKEHMEEQEKIDQHQADIESTAFVIAEVLDCAVVKTEIDM